MSVYRFTGFYAAHYDTPDGSRDVEPGETVDWDTPPDSWWTEVPPETASTSEAAPAPAKAAKTVKE